MVWDDHGITADDLAHAAAVTAMGMALGSWTWAAPICQGFLSKLLESNVLRRRYAADWTGVLLRLQLAVACNQGFLTLLHRPPVRWELWHRQPALCNPDRATGSVAGLGALTDRDFRISTRALPRRPLQAFCWMLVG